MLIVLVTVIFNIVGRAYFEREIVGQLEKISIEGEKAIFQQAPKLFANSRGTRPNPNRVGPSNPDPVNSNQRKLDPFRPDPSDMDPSFDFFMRVNRSLRKPLSILNAEYLLFDSDKNQILNFESEIYTPNEQIKYIKNVISSGKTFSKNESFKFNADGKEYIAIIKQVSDNNPVNLGWIVIYSSLEKVNQMQFGINIILLVILLISAAVIIILSSALSKKLSSPFTAINDHIKFITERKFGSKISLEADDEFLELVSNINLMSEKLETYDKAQKTFLQNVSHEFRTPLMSIQSYAEGITYGVVDSDTAVEVIVGEVKRLTKLVEDLLYLSRLDAIEENYNYGVFDLNDFIKTCIERMNGIAIKNNIEIVYNDEFSKINIGADEETLSRAINNIISNCIRYAKSKVTIDGKLIPNDKIEIRIFDDGPGFDKKDIPNLFERFYKGNKGNYGLGLAISKSVLTKHHGEINAQNYENGALFTIILPTKVT